MVDVERLALRLDDPHRDAWVLQKLLVEVEDDIFTRITVIDLGHFQLSIACNHEKEDALRR